MTLADQIANALRAIAPNRELKAEDVPHVDALAANWEKRSGAGLAGAGAAAAQATNEKPLFDSLRSTLFRGGLAQEQIDGIHALLAAMIEARWPLAYAAYGFATAYHETARTMQPVREAFNLSEGWRRKNLRYYPWYGRGFVQLTWEANYKKADEKLGLGGSLLANKDRAMELPIAAKIMTRGMAEGWFTGKSLATYLPASGPSDHAHYEQARRIINAMDKAGEIAGHAVKFQEALQAAGWK